MATATPTPKKQRPRPGALSQSATAHLTDTSNEITEIQSEYTKLKDQISMFPAEKKIFTKIEEYIITLRCDQLIGKGDKKSIMLCPPYESKFFIVNVLNAQKDEILRHIRILQLYYHYGGIDKLNFKIPNIYLKIIDKEIYYYMDYIDRAKGPNYTKIAKNHNIEDIVVLVNIGKILGYFANITNELIHDFELYLDVTHNKYTIVDFGEFIDLRQKPRTLSERITFNENIYKGIKETFNNPSINIDDFIVKQDIDEYTAMEAALSAERKYLKYKMKYLRLKKQ